MIGRANCILANSWMPRAGLCPRKIVSMRRELLRSRKHIPGTGSFGVGNVVGTGNSECHYTNTILNGQRLFRPGMRIKH
jgi:hypothetical protein